METNEQNYPKMTVDHGYQPEHKPTNIVSQAELEEILSNLSGANFPQESFNKILRNIDTEHLIEN